MVGEMAPRAFVLGIVGLVMATTQVYAETLADAIVEAYQSNPVLQSQRYDLKALDEAYVRAWAAVRPRGELQFTADYVDSRAGDTTQALRLAADPTVGRRLKSNKDDARIVVEQLLYSGGQASSAIDASEYRVRSGREALRIAEGDLILQVVTAYQDVKRDSESLLVRQANIKALERQLEMTEARKVAGEVTTTDVQQAAAQLEAARAQVILAQAELQNSRAAYAALVGHDPGTLEDAPRLPLLPTKLADAFDIADSNSPELQQARFNERESLKLADEARSADHVTVTAQTSYGTNGKFVPFDARDQDREFTVSVTVKKPLFSGGANASQYREALARNTGDRLRIDAARRTNVQALMNAWNQSTAARRNMQIGERQLKAAEIAAEGMQEEFRYGQRSTLDVLIAEQNLRDAQLSLISSRRDAYVAEASVLRQMGYLEARVMIVGLAPYDASENLRNLKHHIGVPWEGFVAGLDGLGKAPAIVTTPKPSNQPPIGYMAWSQDHGENAPSDAPREEK